MAGCVAVAVLRPDLRFLVVVADASAVGECSLLTSTFTLRFLRDGRGSCSADARMLALLVAELDLGGVSWPCRERADAA